MYGGDSDCDDDENNNETRLEHDLLVCGKSIRVDEVWERTSDRYGDKFVLIHDTKSVITTEGMEFTCSFGHELVTVEAPKVQVTCDKSVQLTSRIQKWTNSHLKNTWPPTNRKDALGFLNLLIGHIRSRFRDMDSFCAVCDKPLEHAGCKPMPCEDPLCVFTFEELDYADTLHSYDNSSPVLHLLILLAHSAVVSAGQTRLAAMFSTVPTAFMLEKGGLNWTRVSTTLSALTPQPCFRSPVKIVDNDHRLLLQWLLATNRSEIRLLPVEKQLPMSTNMQFQLFLGDPAAEKKFQKLKKQHGSVYAFHGSAMHNWYGILRNGLKNWSNTPLMTAGAAYGPGVYTALNSQLSAGYCRGYGGGGGAWQCLALCEVARCPTNVTNPSMIVVPNDDAVSLRFLLLYEAGIPAVVAETLRSHPTVLETEQARVAYLG